MGRIYLQLYISNNCKILGSIAFYILL